MNILIKNFTPQWIKQAVRLWRERFLPSEISKLKIKDTGVCAHGDPWVELSEGPRFYGFLPNESQKRIYAGLRKKIPNIEEIFFAIVMDIISRYKAPRSIPGELFFNHSPYMPLRDPLNDFNLIERERKALADLFRPQLGETFVDIGSYLGYGTMRIAELVGPRGRVIAFESDPKILSLLQRNVEENKMNNITIIPKAAAAYAGKSSFFRKNGTANSLNNNILASQGYKDLEEIEVEVSTVDCVLRELSIEKVDKFNITVNGGEVDALSGMKRVLARSDDVRLALAGWYSMPDGRKICDIVEPLLKELGFIVMKGRLGRVLAWKTPGSSKENQQI